MNQTWKLIWDLLAAGMGIYVGYKVYLWSGQTISSFGYVPIGIIAGIIAMVLTALIVHVIEGAIVWCLNKIIK